MTDATITLTTAQAIIRFLTNQYIVIDGQEMRVCGGGFGIFGHGNVTCLGEALYDAKDALPLYRGQNEQGMGFAAAGYAKQWLRQRFMFCTASAGPGTANLLTSAALVLSFDMLDAAAELVLFLYFAISFNRFFHSLAHISITP